MTSIRLIKVSRLGIYSYNITNAKTETLLPIIREMSKPDSLGYTGTFRSYDAIDISEFKHYRINQDKVLSERHKHINGTENFWNQAMRHMRKYNGIKKVNFY